MSLYVGSIVINVSDIDRAIAFWTAALNYTLGRADVDFAILTDPRRRWSNVSLQLSDAPKQGRNRLHLDLYTPEQEAEVARLVKLGAKRLDWEYPADADFIVLGDPDDNEFCVIQTDFKQD